MSQEQLLSTATCRFVMMLEALERRDFIAYHVHRLAHQAVVAAQSGVIVFTSY